jgi:hypothetical protein
VKKIPKKNFLPPPKIKLMHANHTRLPSKVNLHSNLLLRHRSPAKVEKFLGKKNKKVELSLHTIKRSTERVRARKGEKGKLEAKRREERDKNALPPLVILK